MGLVSSNAYQIGRGSASGQVSIVDGYGKVVSYADSEKEARELVRNLNEQQETQTVQDLSPFNLLQGYWVEKENGYKGTFKEYEKEIKDSLASSAVPVVINSASTYKAIDVDATEEAFKKFLLEDKIQDLLGQLNEAYRFEDKSRIFYITNDIAHLWNMGSHGWLLVTRGEGSWSNYGIKKASFGAKFEGFEVDVFNSFFIYCYTEPGKVAEAIADNLAHEMSHWEDDQNGVSLEGYIQPEDDYVGYRTQEIEMRAVVKGVARELLRQYGSAEEVFKKLDSTSNDTVSFYRDDHPEYYGKFKELLRVCIQNSYTPLFSSLKQIQSIQELSSLGVDSYYFETPARDIPFYEFIAKSFADNGVPDFSVKDFITQILESNRLVWLSLTGDKITGVMGCREDPQDWAGTSEKGVRYKGFTGFFLVKLVKGISRELVDDVYKVLDMLLGMHDYVSWSAESNNPAISAYRKYVQERGGVEVTRGSKSFFIRSNIPEIEEVFRVGVSTKNVGASFGALGGVNEWFVDGAFNGGGDFCGKEKSFYTDLQTVGSTTNNVGYIENSYTGLFSGGDGVISITSSLSSIIDFNEVDRLLNEGKLPEWIKIPLSDPRMKRYQYLLSVNMEWDPKESLYSLIKNLRKRGFQCEWVISGNRLTGVLSYMVGDKEIYDLKIFSLSKNPEGMLKGDFTNFVKEKVKDGYDVSWSSHKDNSPVPAYKDIVDLFNGGKWRQKEDNAQILDFYIPRQTGVANVQVAPSEDVKSSESFSSFGLQSVLHGSVLASHGGRLSGLAGQQERTQTTNNAELIESATIQELLDNNDPSFFHRKQHLDATKAQGDSEIMRVFGSSVEMRTKSEHFSSNNTYYRQWVMFKDFILLMKDKKIKLDEAVDYALNYGDITCRCSCPDQTFRGFSYMGDQLQYLYGLPREKRFPKRNNPNLVSSTCKHMDMALNHLMKNKEKIIKMFSLYYDRLEETPEDTMIAIPAKAVEKEEMPEEEKNLLGALGEEVPEEGEVESEVISEQEPETGTFKVDTKKAEGLLPPEQQVKYAGEEEKPTDEVTAEAVADEVTDEEVQELENEIDEVIDNPLSEDEKFTTEWSFQRFKRKGYSDLLVSGTHGTLIGSSYFLGGALSSFSDAVRDLMPKGSSPSKIGTTKSYTAGYMEYPYMSRTLRLGIYFFGTKDGTGFVSVTGDISKVMNFVSLDDLRTKFPTWFSDLRGGYE